MRKDNGVRIVGRPPVDPEIRFWEKVNKDGPLHPRLGTRCWVWTGCSGSSGYGQIEIGGKMVYAHRFSYGLANPVDAQVDHICRNKLCVNPSHLRPATNKQNTEHRDASSNSKSGVRGVWWSKRDQRWIGQVTHEGRKHFIGSFDSLEEAAEAARIKRNELFTHNDLDKV